MREMKKGDMTETGEIDEEDSSSSDNNDEINEGSSDEGGSSSNESAHVTNAVAHLQSRF